MYDFLRKKLIYETEKRAKEQTRKYQTRQKELDIDSNSDFWYVCSDIILKIIMHCRKKNS